MNSCRQIHFLSSLNRRGVSVCMCMCCAVMGSHTICQAPPVFQWMSWSRLASHSSTKPVRSFVRSFVAMEQQAEHRAAAAAAAPFVFPYCISLSLTGIDFAADTSWASRGKGGPLQT
jgi:hypothetical protein